VIILEEIYYKIGEVSDLLGIEQHTLRYLEHSLKLKIQRDERGDRLYTENDLDILKMILKLKNEKGLNTTAIKMALENMKENENDLMPATTIETMLPALIEMNGLANRIIEQNEELIRQNQILTQRIEEMEKRLDIREKEKNSKIDELIILWRAEQEKNKSWFAKIRGK
jgi:MerR family transcriptional regulator, aldehyde-responsive regulator